MMAFAQESMKFLKFVLSAKRIKRARGATLHSHTMAAFSLWPEGAPVGVVKNLSYLCHVTIRSDSKPIYDILRGRIQEIDNLAPNELYGKVKVIVNGSWIGIVEDAYVLYLFLKQKKYLM